MIFRSRPKLSGPPSLIMGGHANALSIARSLGSRGVRVRALAAPDWPIRHSRHVDIIPLTGERLWESAADFLLTSKSDYLRGSVLLAATDEALSIVIDHRQELQEKYLLDRCNPVAQRRLLDKITTYQAAQEAGVPTPRFWVVRGNLDAVADELVFPLLIKPRMTHLTWEVLRGRKHITAHNIHEASRAVEFLAGREVEFFLVEKIPGPDDLLCSYYTYLDEQGNSFFDFTKRIIRRHPKNMGLATYHITDHIPELKEPSLRLFRHVGLQGLTNVEYKKDPRDGVYKLIECNARFTGGTSLVAASGLDLAEFVYRQITGLPPMPFEGYRDGVRLWEPVRDFKAFLELRRLGELTLWQWLRSVSHRQTFAIWSLRDPGPNILPLVKEPVPTLRKLVRLGRRVLGRK